MARDKTIVAITLQRRDIVVATLARTTMTRQETSAFLGSGLGSQRDKFLTTEADASAFQVATYHFH